jgi:hypothetical protein
MLFASGAETNEEQNWKGRKGEKILGSGKGIGVVSKHYAPASSSIVFPNYRLPQGGMIQRFECKAETGTTEKLMTKCRRDACHLSAEVERLRR